MWRASAGILIFVFLFAAPVQSSHPQRVDPVLTFSTYLGGAGAQESINDIKVDSAGNAYVTYDDYDSTGPSHDFMVSKISPTGAIGYTTVLGHFYSDESATAIAVDAAGNAYITGWAFSYTGDHPRFPSLKALQPEPAGGVDAIVVKLNAQGKVVFSTYLGGSGNDYGRDITLDSSGNIYVTGTTSSDDFPLRSPYQARRAGGGESGNDVFVTKLNATGSVILYSTYLGGNDDDSVAAIAVDAGGSVYVAGSSRSATVGRQSNGPRLIPVCNNPAGIRALAPCWNGYAVKFNPAGTDLAYSFAWSDVNQDHVVADAALDGNGNLYIAESSFLRKLNSTGSGFLYSMNIPGELSAISVDGSGNALLAGRTPPDRLGRTQDVYAVKIPPNGGPSIYALSLNGTIRDDIDRDSGAGLSAGTAIAVTPAGSVYIGGQSESLNFPTTNRSTRSPRTRASSEDAILFVLRP